MAPRLCPQRPHSWLATEGPSTRWQPSLTLNNQSSVHSWETSGTINGQGPADLIPGLVSENGIFFYWGGTQGCREAAVACVGRAGNLMTSSGNELQVGCS